MSPSPVTVIVLTWGRFEETIECLESLRRVRYSPLRVLVVDNASGGDYVPRLRMRFPEVEVVESSVNLGYAGGNNLGLRHAVGHGAVYALVLNNDTVVDPDFVSIQVAAAEKDPRIAAVGARIMQLERPDRIFCIGGHLTWNPTLIKLDGLNEPGAGVEGTRDIEMISGCAILFRSSALEDIGYFDERFFAYHEDVDWCARAREAGYRVVSATGAIVYHRRAPGLGRPRLEPHLYYFYGRNAILYAHKHANRMQWARLLSLSIIWLAGSLVKRTLSGEPFHQVWKTVRLIALGMVDGWKLREPPYELLELRPREAS